jgi:hypothetical protein
VSEQHTPRGAEQHDVSTTQAFSVNRFNLHSIAIANERPHASAMGAKNQAMLAFQYLDGQIMEDRMFQAPGIRPTFRFDRIIHAVPSLCIASIPSRSWS